MIDMRFAHAVVKHRIAILIVTILLMVPAVFGYVHMRVNYDMLTYLPPIWRRFRDRTS